MTASLHDPDQFGMLGAPMLGQALRQHMVDVTRAMLQLPVSAAVAQLHEHGQELQQQLMQHRALMSAIVSGQVEPQPELLLLEASSILCRSHIILEASKALLHTSADAALVMRALQVAESALEMCTSQLSEAAMLIDAGEEAESTDDEEAVDLQERQQQQQQQQHMLLLHLLGQVPGGLVAAAAPPNLGPEDEELSDTGTSCPTVAAAVL